MSGLSLIGESLEASWELFTGRYENKRLFIRSHFDQLFSESAQTAKTPAALTTVLNTISEYLMALESMDLPAKELSDAILVNHISKQFDRMTTTVENLNRRTHGISNLQTAREIFAVSDTSAREN